MKKIIPICIIVTMVFTCSISLCFGAEATKPSVSVKVLATLTESSCMISEKVSVAARTYSRSAKVSDLTVTSVVEDQAVTVENIKAVGSNGWTAVSADDVDTAARDSKYINLSMDGNDLTTTAGYDLPDGYITNTKTFSLTGTIAAQSDTMNGTEVAKLVITLNFSGIITVDGFDVHDLKKVTWTDGTDVEIAAVVEALDEGLLTVSDLVWQVGDSRNVTLTSGSTASLVIWDANTGSETASEGYKLTTQKGNTLGSDYEYTSADKKTASYIIGIENLNMEEQISSTNKYAYSWKNLGIRTTVNNIYSTLPTDIQSMFKPFETITATGAKASTIESVSDNLALTATKEVIGGDQATSQGSTTGYSCVLEFNTLTQFQYFETTANRTMYVNGTADAWWQRSPSNSTATYCFVNGTNAKSYNQDGEFALVPFGCI